MARKTDEHTERNDKRSAAIHEAGHLTVALAAGISGSAWVTPTNTTDLLNDKAWSGTFGAYGPMSAVIAMAGIVAECLADDANIDEIAIDDFLFNDVIMPSETDRQHFPDGDEIIPTIREALDLLRKHRVFHEWAIQQLIENGIITNGMADENFPVPANDD